MGNRIDKPWGYEELLTLTDRYCFKRLFLRAGHRTSLQYHEQKHETMYFISGEGTIEIHDGAGNVETRPIVPGEAIAVAPHTIHRVIAEKDTLYVEASTPELADVVRLQDDYKRI
ncbi:MAG: cupin domain-containing protein [Acidobacteriota bacterium]|nr:MAG: cupin domain-containing protein [Acidobacteriota bacterium]